MSNIIKLFFLGMLITFCACSSPSVKHFTVFCTNTDFGVGNRSLSMNFKSDSTSFDRQATGVATLKQWDSIMGIFHYYREKKPYGGVSVVPPDFNLCDRTQIMFYEDNFPLCYICLDEGKKLISVNDELRSVEQSEIARLKSLLQIDCSFAEYVVDGDRSAEYSVKDVFVK